MQHKVIDTKDVVIRFAGDSGDGMQLTGSLFADMSAIFGNELSTFPDYPAEIRAPHGTVSGVSGFQVHIGSEQITTPGDFCDLLVAMNPAALKANAKWLNESFYNPRHLLQLRPQKSSRQTCKWQRCRGRRCYQTYIGLGTSASLQTPVLYLANYTTGSRTRGYSPLRASRLPDGFE